MCNVSNMKLFLFQPLVEDTKTDSNGNGVTNHELTSDYSSEYSKAYSNCYSNGVNNGYMATAATNSDRNSNPNVTHRTSSMLHKQKQRHDLFQKGQIRNELIQVKKYIQKHSIFVEVTQVKILIFYGNTQKSTMQKQTVMFVIIIRKVL